MTRRILTFGSLAMLSLGVAVGKSQSTAPASDEAAAQRELADRSRRRDIDYLPSQQGICRNSQRVPRPVGFRRGDRCTGGRTDADAVRIIRYWKHE